MSWSSQKKKRKHFLYRLYCPKEFLKFLGFLLICSLLNTLSKYTYFYVWKNIASYTFLLALI